MTEYTYARVVDGIYLSGDVVTYHEKLYPELPRVGIYRLGDIVSADGTRVQLSALNITVVSVTRMTPKVEIPTRPGVYSAVNKQGQKFLLMLVTTLSNEQWFLLRGSGPDAYSKSSKLMTDMEKFTYIHEFVN